MSTSRWTWRQISNLHLILLRSNAFHFTWWCLYCLFLQHNQPMLFWVCPCNKMRANPSHATHIHTRIRFFDSPPFDIIWYHLRLCTRLLLLLPKYVWSRSNEIRSSTAYNQTEKMLKLLPTSSMLLSSKQYCLGCYVCKKE